MLMFLAWIAQQLHASATPNDSAKFGGVHHIMGTSCGSCHKLSWSQESSQHMNEQRATKDPTLTTLEYTPCVNVLGMALL